MKKSFILTLILFITLFFVGCSSLQGPSNKSSKKENLTKEQSFNITLEEAATDLARQYQLKTENRLLTLTKFKGLGDLATESLIGKKIEDTIVAKMETLGYSFFDARGLNKLYIDQDGRVNMQSSPKFVNKMSVGKSDVIVATYSYFQNELLLNIRIVDSKNGQVLAFSRALLDIGYGKNTPYFNGQENKTPTHQKEKRTMKIASTECLQNDCLKKKKRWKIFLQPLLKKRKIFNLM